jgi:hypothetical protein
VKGNNALSGLSKGCDGTCEETESVVEMMSERDFINFAEKYCWWVKMVEGVPGVQLKTNKSVSVTSVPYERNTLWEKESLRHEHG